MPPRWGFSLYPVVYYKHAAPNGAGAAAVFLAAPSVALGRIHDDRDLDFLARFCGKPPVGLGPGPLARAIGVRLQEPRPFENAGEALFEQFPILAPELPDGQPLRAGVGANVAHRRVIADGPLDIS